jgi:hypothetical protein
VDGLLPAMVSTKLARLPAKLTWLPSVLAAMPMSPSAVQPLDVQSVTCLTAVVEQLVQDVAEDDDLYQHSFPESCAVCLPAISARLVLVLCCKAKCRGNQCRRLARVGTAAFILRSLFSVLREIFAPLYLLPMAAPTIVLACSGHASCRCTCSSCGRRRRQSRNGKCTSYLILDIATPAKRTPRL